MWAKSSVTTFDEVLTLWRIFKVFGKKLRKCKVLGKFLNLALTINLLNWANFTIENGQILNKPSVHLVTLWLRVKEMSTEKSVLRPKVALRFVSLAFQIRVLRLELIRR